MGKQQTILITGASGFLGWNLFHYLGNRFRVIGTYGSHRPDPAVGEFCRLDIRRENEIRQVLDSLRPDAVIHTAAITSPAVCLENKQDAWETNVEGTAAIARASERLNCRLISMSTDRVFDGRKGDYTEEDQPNPLGFYGKTKVEAEKQIRELCPTAVILRLPLLYGPPSPYYQSFVSPMIESFRKHKPLGLFTDQFRTPLYVEDAAKAIETILSLTDITGLFHLGGPERISRADFGYEMARIFDFNPDDIRPIAMAAKPHLPPSPSDASLNSEKLYRLLNFRPRGVKTGLRSLRKSLLE